MLLESLPGGHGDACLGITHLRSPAKSMHGIAAFNDTGPFLPDEAVQQFLSESRNLAAGLWEPPSCVDFKPVGTLGRRAEENFAYCDLMLDSIQQQYQEGTGRKLVCFFLDIACQFSSYWNSPEQSALHDQVVDLQQRIVRCQEESSSSLELADDSDLQVAHDEADSVSDDEDDMFHDLSDGTLPIVYKVQSSKISSGTLPQTESIAKASRRVAGNHSGSNLSDGSTISMAAQAEEDAATDQQL
ncbi:MAG: hypothetical protein FRX49_12943 [Trebouxia sp. A1-2]|nr:MAG: hypothetical protein FRX49_12943 [Trebouxia sp. A1-2]